MRTPIILGLSGFYHDSAACLVGGGEIVAAAQEERFTRIKHDHNFPARACGVGFLIGNTVLAAIYLLIFTPVGWAMRALGRSSLSKGFNRSTPSYWRDTPASADPLRYYRQFQNQSIITKCTLPVGGVPSPRKFPAATATSCGVRAPRLQQGGLLCSRLELDHE